MDVPVDVEERDEDWMHSHFQNRNERWDMSRIFVGFGIVQFKDHNKN